MYVNYFFIFFFSATIIYYIMAEGKFLIKDVLFWLGVRVFKFEGSEVSDERKVSIG